MEPQALLLYRSNQPLDHAILLWRMRSDELLFETIVIYRPRVAPTGKNQSIVRSNRQVILRLAQNTVAGDQGLFQSSFSRLCVASGAEPPA